jgi:hypothetical protein
MWPLVKFLLISHAMTYQQRVASERCDFFRSPMPWHISKGERVRDVISSDLPRHDISAKGSKWEMWFLPEEITSLTCYLLLICHGVGDLKKSHLSLATLCWYVMAWEIWRNHISHLLPFADMSWHGRSKEITSLTCYPLPICHGMGDLKKSHLSLATLCWYVMAWEIWRNHISHLLPFADMSWHGRSEEITSLTCYVISSDLPCHDISAKGSKWEMWFLQISHAMTYQQRVASERCDFFRSPMPWHISKG